MVMREIPIEMVWDFFQDRLEEHGDRDLALVQTSIFFQIDRFTLEAVGF